MLQSGIWILGAFLWTASGFANLDVQLVKVAGRDGAEVSILTNHAPEELPTFQVSENKLEFSLKNARLHESLQGKVELDHPHALIERAVILPKSQNVVVQLWVNGSLEDIKDRVVLSKSASGISLKLSPPKTINAALELLREEQAPFGESDKKSVAAKTESHLFQWVGLCVLVLLAAVGSAYVYRFVKSQNRRAGDRRYLIEPLAYYSYGPRIGVSLVKIGKEFVLLGVTPNGINMLSSLPGLALQYQEESRFERGQFKDAVEEEVAKLQKQIGL